MNASAPQRFPLAYVPLAVFAALVAVFVIRLSAGDPSKLPSTRIGKPAPTFALPPLAGSGQPGLSTADLGGGRVSLVNVFASWCAPCREEHPQLMDLAKDGRFALFGLNQKDRPENARDFLARLGNPYRAIGADADGRASIEWGVYGVPETFLIGRDGTVRYKHIGPLTPDAVREKFIPEIEKALAR